MSIPSIASPGWPLTLSGFELSAYQRLIAFISPDR
jgi:hypothetical protein